MTQIEFEETYNNLFNSINPKGESIILPCMIKKIFKDSNLIMDLKKIFDYYSSIDPDFYFELAKRIKIFINMFIREYHDIQISIIDENDFSFERLLNEYNAINNKLEKATKSEKEKYNSLLNALLSGVRVSLYEYRNIVYKDSNIGIIKKENQKS